MQFEKTIREISKKNRVSPEQVLEEMSTAIQSAKDTQYFRQIFGEKEPGVEEFVARLACIAMKED